MTRVFVSRNHTKLLRTIMPYLSHRVAVEAHRSWRKSIEEGGAIVCPDWSDWVYQVDTTALRNLQSGDPVIGLLEPTQESDQEAQQADVVVPGSRGGIRSLVLVIEDEALRGRLQTWAAGAGYAARTVANKYTAGLDDPEQEAVIIETGSNAAALVRIVYRLYDQHPAVGCLPIVALGRRKTLRENPSLAVWDMHGHAALSATVLVETDHYREDLSRVLSRM